MSSYSLVVEKGRSKGKSLRLKPNGSAVVGREGGNQLVISDPQCSRKHFKIDAKLGEFVLHDLKSSNGTFVNGQRIAETIKLSEGDKIAIGDTLVYFLKEAQDPEGAPRRGELTGREIAGYRIGRLLGRGGMGTVYEAVQISLERKVAFKTLAPELTKNPEFIDRFISEARAAGRLSHANIVAVFDVGNEGDLYFYSMEYMAGGSVEELLREKKTVPFEETIPIIFDAARGLEYAEKHGLIHRDIKPDNLMLGADDVVKICDLGLATFSSRQHEVSGSPHYIAPEQALGKEIDSRVDIYALGVSWYQLLCGETPFSGSSAQEIARKHVEETPPPLSERAPGVPPEVIALVEHMMAKDPAQRLGSARQLQADLAELARRYPIRETVLLRIDAVAPDEPPSDALLEATPPALSGQSLSWIALALLAVALLAGAFLITRGLMDKSQARKKWARERLQEVVGMLEEGNLDLAERSSQTLVTRFEEEGLEEEASKAKELGEQAVARRKDLEREATEREAKGKLAQASKLFEDHGGKPDDPSSVARLEQVGKLLDLIIKDYPETQSAKDAQELRKRVADELDKAEEAQRALARRQAEARRTLTRLRAGLETLLSDSIEGKYTKANERVRSFEQEFGDVLPGTTQQLSDWIESECRKEVAERRTRAIQLGGRGEWAAADEALRPVRPPLGFPEQEKKVRETVQRLETMRGQASRDQRAQQERADVRLREAARSRIAKDCQLRDYQRAESAYRGEVVKLTTERQTQLARTRADRLAGAARSLTRLAEHVRSKKKNSGIEKVLDFKGGGRKRAPATEVDFRGRKYTFEHPPYIASLTIDEFEPGELLDFFDAVALDPRGKLDLARLAYELGERPRAAALLTEATAQDPDLRREADDLRLLDQE